jgi:hypothetical protein
LEEEKIGLMENGATVTKRSMELDHRYQTSLSKLEQENQMLQQKDVML